MPNLNTEPQFTKDPPKIYHLHNVDITRKNLSEMSHEEIEKILTLIVTRPNTFLKPKESTLTEKEELTENEELTEKEKQCLQKHGKKISVKLRVIEESLPTTKQVYDSSTTLKVLVEGEKSSNIDYMHVTLKFPEDITEDQKTILQCSCAKILHKTASSISARSGVIRLYPSSLLHSLPKVLQNVAVPISTLPKMNLDTDIPVEFPSTAMHTDKRLQSAFHQIHPHLEVSKSTETAPISLNQQSQSQSHDDHPVPEQGKIWHLIKTTLSRFKPNYQKLKDSVKNLYKKITRSKNAAQNDTAQNDTTQKSLHNSAEKELKSHESVLHSENRAISPPIDIHKEKSMTQGSAETEILIDPSVNLKTQSLDDLRRPDTSSLTSYSKSKSNHFTQSI